MTHAAAFLAGLFVGVLVVAASVTWQAMRESEPFVEPYGEPDFV